jgi:hypothetical protein
MLDKLLSFCADADSGTTTRYNGSAWPKIIGAFVYATDTKCAYRHPAGVCDQFPPIENLTQWAYFPLDRSKCLPEIPKRGELYKMFPADDDGGVMLIPQHDEEPWFKLEHCEYQLYYLRKISRLPGVRVQEIRVKGSWCLFWECDGGGQGMLIGRVEESKSKGGDQ